MKGANSILFTIFFISLAFFTEAQNLVKNPGFELDYLSSESTSAEERLGEGWRGCNGGILYSLHGSNAFFVGNLKSKPHTGENYAGLLFYRRGVIQKDLLIAQLQKPLEKGKMYRVGLHLLYNSVSKYTINSVDFHLSQKNRSCDSLFQISEPSAKYFSLVELDDSNNWMLISCSYLAKGGEQFLTIGSLDANLPNSGEITEQTDTLGFFFEPFADKQQGAGYFIDDVFVMEEEQYLQKNRIVKLERGTTLVLQNILFEADKSELLPESFSELLELVELLKKNSSISIVVRGHTDNSGTLDYNQKLSEARAQTVESYLIDNGVNGSRIKTWGFGSTRPLSSNLTEEGRAINRRVEIQVK